MAQIQTESGPRTYLFQYTAASGFDTRLAENVADDFSWSENASDIAPGDFVILQRAGTAPGGLAAGTVWSGVTGWGRARSGPVAQDGRRTARTVDLLILAFRQSAIPRAQYCYDHRLAAVGAVFGQQGSNFLLHPDAAAAMFERIEAGSMVSSSETVPRSEIPRDAVTLLLDQAPGGTTLQAARILNAARAFAAVAEGRRNEITWSRLLIGLIYFGLRLRADAKTGALLRILAELAESVGAVDGYVAELAGRDLALLDLDWRKAEAATRMSPSAEKALLDAAGLADGQPVSAETLLAALLRDPVHDDDRSYHRIFGCDRSTLIGILMEGAKARARTVDTAMFAARLGLKGPTSSRSGSTAEREERASLASPAPPRLNLPRVASTLNDTVKHGEDFLDVRHEARAFARLIASSSFEPPLAIGVFGHWGSGKTFFMDRIAEELDRFTAAPGAPGAGSGALRHIVPIRFNAWHYMETNVWASLVDVIFRELDGWLRRATTVVTAPDDPVDRLFESLSTAQAERLEAIEVVADRLGAREEARQRVDFADSAREGHWKAVAEELIGGDFEEAAKALGLDGLVDEGKKLKAAIGSVQAAGSDTSLLWTSLRSRVTDLRWLLVLIALVAVAPLLFAWIGEQIADEPVVAALTGLVIAATAWTTALANSGRTAVAAMRRLHEAFLAVEEQRRTAKEDTLVQHDDRLAEARRLLVEAETAAAEAQRRLYDGSAAGRIAAFIRSRAEGDTYSRHLGIIATVRRDFEQLTALMAESRQQARHEMEALDRQRAETQTRIEALRARYLDEAAGPAPLDAFRPVADALDRLEKVNAQGNPLGISIGRIVLFVDDLDRCPPDKVYRVLQAVHLFLSFPLFVVVVGVDTRWMEASLEKELEGLVDGDGGATPQDYLEKIFQIPYWTRRMDIDASRAFVDGVLGRLPVGEPTADGGRATVAPPGVTTLAVRPTQVAEALQRTVDEAGGEAGEAAEPEEDKEVAELIGLPAAPVITNFEPVVLTSTERDMIRELAPEAGRSPRQLLRFVNVYGLVKSVIREDGSSAIDPENNPLGCRALLTQLAIATGSPRAASAYFRILERHALTDDDCFRKELFSTFGSEDLPLLERTATVEVLRRYFESAGVSVHFETELKFDIDEEVTANQNRAFRALVEPASIARRYTFAAVGVSQSAADAEVVRGWAESVVDTPSKDRAVAE